MDIQQRIRDRRLLAAAGIMLAVGLVAAPSTTLAKAGDVRVNGDCTGSSTSKLKLSPDNGRIEVEWEVDSNHNGQTWNVRLRNDGVKFFSGQKVTKAPSGSFTVHKRTSNGAGTDTITARARNAATGEVCTATADI